MIGKMEESLRNPDEGPPRRVQAVEAAVFLLLIVPSMLMSATVARPGNLSFPLVAVAALLTDIPLLCLVLFFLWRNQEPFSFIGLTLRKGWLEAAIGVILFVPLMLGMNLLEAAFRSAGLSMLREAPAFLVPSGADQIALALVLLVVVAVSEEVIFRGYLIRRFTVLSKNPVTALVLSSAIFAMGHAYERSGGVASVAAMALIFGAVYLWRRSLVAPIVMHFIQDFIGIILIPLGVLSP
jgi:membrane protease YdiL (CAAX protease family)